MEKKIRLCLLTALRCAKRSGSVRSLAAIIAKGLCLSLLVLAVGCAHRQAAVVDNAARLYYPSSSSSEAAASLSTTEKQPGAPHPKRADFEREPKSRDAQHVADWVVDSGDNSGMPFAIVDKKDAKVFVFYTDGRLRGAAPALLGIAKGDDSTPGIGDRKMSEMGTEERTTPAGRFVAALGYNFHGKDILWVDYDGAVSLHRVVTNNPKERRLQRLATPTPLDNRISYGCINVPANFFNTVVSPAFAGTYGIVYVLPEIRSKSEIFASYYDVDSRWGAGKTADLAEGSRVSRQQ
ncbi:MAG: hypothetical protein AB9866_26530 [Syntrophobacteraceae bacterium]